jgi:serine/threonine protein phosphatase PrpC
MSMTIKAQSISKHDGDFVSQNEDAIRTEKSLFALSDGAGGTGVEAHQWAQYLLQNLPETPIFDFAALSDWQDGIWQTYFDNIKNQLENSRSNALDKFYTEGSSATLAAAWLEGRGKNKKAHILSYGDSVALLWREKTGEYWTNIADLTISKPCRFKKATF